MNEIGMNELGMNELGMNEIGMNEIGMNELEMNEMPPREEQMTQTKNATTKNGTAERIGVRGLTTGYWSTGVNPNFKPYCSSCYALKLQFQSAPQNINPVMAGNHAGRRPF